MKKNKTILFVVNVDWYFISHRLVLAREAVRAGFDVVVATRDTGRRPEIEAVGATFIHVDFSRSGKNPLKEFLSLYELFKVYRKVKPAVIHHIAMKPVVYGTIVAKWLNIPVINAVNGLGFVFHEGESGLVSKIIERMMKYGFKAKRLTCIFQNKEDKADLTKLGIITEKTPSVMIKGAGVDLNKFAFSPPPQGEKLQVVLAARLLWSKGIKEFKEASELLYDKYKDKVEFKLVGMADEEHQEGISPQQLKDWKVGEYFQWVPYQIDMVKVFTNSDIVVLPSYYREGVPKSLLEACSVGRPIITTNSIGCKECVDQDINGLKVEPKSASMLAEAIETLVNDSEMRLRMGKNSRKKAEAEFNVEAVTSTHLELYREAIDA